MRLIDADALIEFCAERWIPLNVDAVNMQPTIQPERKTGKWILKDDKRYHCSSCDGIAPKGYRWSFCPECGADTRGGDK